jgi:hypothetical protein
MAQTAPTEGQKHGLHAKNDRLFLGTLSAHFEAVVGKGLSSLGFLCFSGEAVPIAATWKE